MTTRGRTRSRVPRVVLDTNVLLSALVFARGPTAALRTAWQTMRFTPLVSTTTAQELMRVLAYPKFKLGASAREELLADYLPWTEVVQIPEPPPAVPHCRDVHDLPFLHLAEAGHATVLVSGDADLLVLAQTLPPLRFAIVTPATFMADLDAD